MRILEYRVWPWIISVLIGMFIIWDSIAASAAANIYVNTWVELSALDYFIAYSLILSVGLSLLWWAWCAFRRKWVFIAVSIGTSVFIVFAAALFGIVAFVMLTE